MCSWFVWICVAVKSAVLFSLSSAKMTSAEASRFLLWPCDPHMSPFYFTLVSPCRSSACVITNLLQTQFGIFFFLSLFFLWLLLLFFLMLGWTPTLPFHSWTGIENNLLPKYSVPLIPQLFLAVSGQFVICSLDLELTSIIRATRVEGRGGGAGRRARNKKVWSESKWPCEAVGLLKKSGRSTVRRSLRNWEEEFSSTYRRKKKVHLGWKITGSPTFWALNTMHDHKCHS